MPGPAFYSGTMNIAKNDDWVVYFVYCTANSDGTQGPAIDLTGSYLKMEVRANETDNEAIIWVDSNPGNGIYINADPTTGGFTIVIDRATRLNRIEPGTYIADLVRLAPSGYQERLIDFSIVNVDEGTTR